MSILFTFPTKNVEIYALIALFFENYRFLIPICRILDISVKQNSTYNLTIFFFIPHLTNGISQFSTYLLIGPMRSYNFWHSSSSDQLDPSLIYPTGRLIVVPHRASEILSFSELILI